jgi:cell division protease FtsH
VINLKKPKNNNNKNKNNDSHSRSLVKNIALILLLFFVMASVFSLFEDPNAKKVEDITLTELAVRISEEKVKEIVIEGDNLDIELKDGVKERSLKEKDTSLPETLRNLGVSEEKINKVNISVKRESEFSKLMGSLLPFLIPLLFLGLILWMMLGQAQKANVSAMSFGRSTARLLKPGEKKKRTTFKDVAGVKEAKEELEEIIDFLKNPKKFTDMGARVPRGVLLLGPPGCGKTLLAKAVAGEADVPFFNVSGSEFVEMFVGVGASRVRDLFKNAKKNAPSILFIDEIDAVGRHRGTGMGGGHDEREQTLNQILVEMDGFDTTTNVIVMAATNRPDVLDPALLRPGRFDRRIVLDNPDIGDREAILNIHIKSKPMAKNADIRRVAERTPGFSGADLANLVNEAAIKATRDGKKVVSQEDILASIEKVMLGPERKSHILSEKEKKIAAYHEAGHALVGHILPHCDPVQKVSIISRGKAAGYTLSLPIEDKHLHSRSEFVDDLAMFLGGYAAEKMVFNDLTTGASNDLERAAKLAHQLVTKFGMSEKLGPITFGNRTETIFLGKEFHEQRYSEKVAAEIDVEIEKFITDACQTAEKVLTENRGKLDKIAEALIKKETIEREEFEKLMG